VKGKQWLGDRWTTKSEEGIYLHLVETLIKWCLSMWKIKSNVQSDLKPLTQTTRPRQTSSNTTSNQGPQLCMINVASKLKLEEAQMEIKFYILVLSIGVPHYQEGCITEFLTIKNSA
jgi:hypothetical protein